MVEVFLAAVKTQFYFMKTKQQKREDLKKLEQKISSSAITIFTGFAPACRQAGGKGEKGLSVAQMRELKHLLKDAGSEYLVAKKTILERALKQVKHDGVNVYDMEGSLGVVVGHPADGDAYAIAKKAYEFSRKNQALKFFGAWFGGAFLGAEQFLEMAKMPSREVLLSQLLGMMKYPISAMAMVLKQIADKQLASS